ncbi:tetratricopeptide repeat protein [Hymenobacter sp. H14-R3]|uniref:tetratricopeptide repeat protein n=1 Tax=Hymenobacter sp. H14-R3 TaxID=3046308 RepID=UPI0024B8E229|nr:tetratricopeptide repeat protein [Hymenobacter sp. H14-R3]MDJ0365319.1 tetratricopeptide repeat protein [Hymenobacter sp. H14-R3]
MLTTKELDDTIHQHILQLGKAGDEFMEQGNYPDAIAQFRAAFGLLPEPYQDWEASLWLLTSLGEAYYFASEYTQAYAALAKAMHVPGAIGNPLIHLRLGEIQFELGNTQRATDELLRAYMGGGKEIFANEDKKYADFLKQTVTF